MFSTWWISWQADQQQLVRHGSVCVYQCRSIYLIGVWPPKNFLLSPWPATCILFPIFIDKNCCVVSTERERRTRACLFWQLSRLDGLSCSWTDIVSHGVALNSMQRTTAVCLIATSKLSADSSGTTPWRFFFLMFFFFVLKVEWLVRTCINITFMVVKTSFVLFGFVDSTELQNGCQESNLKRKEIYNAKQKSCLFVSHVRKFPHLIQTSFHLNRTRPAARDGRDGGKWIVAVRKKALLYWICFSLLFFLYAGLSPPFFVSVNGSSGIYTKALYSSSRA